MSSVTEVEREMWQWTADHPVLACLASGVTGVLLILAGRMLQP